MRYVCLGILCFEYDDHLRANGHWAGGEALQSPEIAVTLYWQ